MELNDVWTRARAELGNLYSQWLTTNEELQTANSSFATSADLDKQSLNELRTANKLAAEANDLLRAQNEALKQQLVVNDQAKNIMQGIATTLEGVRLSVSAPIRADMERSLGPKQLTMLETIDLIAEKRMSFARYGDGEIRLMMREEFNLRFQKNTPGLKSDLYRVFNMSSDRLLIGMPHRFVNSMWSSVFAENWTLMEPVLENVQVLVDIHVSRPIFFDFYQQAAVDAWRRVWEKRDALIVAGKGSRFERIDALFNNLGEVDIVEGAPKNAYIEIDSIMNKIVSKLDGKDLVLIALGPSGTILAARLAELGVQAIDIGHIAASYRSVFSGDLFPEFQPLSQLEAR